MPDDSVYAQASKLADGGGVGGGAGGGGFGDFLGKNPGLATAVGVGASTIPLALNRGNQLPYQGPLQGLATQGSSAYSATQGYAQTLEQPLVTGVLPPGAQASVDLAKRKADADIKSRYGNLGLSGSTMEADQLALNEQNVAAMQFKIEQEMANTGLRAGDQAIADLKLQNDIYSTLMKAQMEQDKGLASAIGGFATAAGKAFGLGGGGGKGAAAGGDLISGGEAVAGADTAGEAMAGADLGDAAMALALV